MAGKITIVTFGYKFGGPEGEFAHTADVRGIPMIGSSAGPDNTGNDPKIKKEIMAKPAAKKWLAKMEAWSVKAGDRIAIGCSRGHHRSVALASEYASFLRGKGFDVSVSNRDISKKYTLTVNEFLLLRRDS